MQKTSRILLFVLALAATLLSACGGVTAPAVTQPGAAKVQAVEVAFTGVLESMDGNQWVVNGQAITVDPSIVRDGPFIVGDTVKVEGVVNADGTIVASRVEVPGPGDLVNDNANANSNDDNGNDANSNDDNSNGSQNGSQPLIFDDARNEAFGTVDAITGSDITVGGETFTFLPGAELKGDIQPGTFVKLHFVTAADGTLAVREVEITDPSQIGDVNGNANDNANSNDDNGKDNNSNDDNGNNNNGGNDNSNSDKGGSSGGDDGGGDSSSGGGDD
jgi:uncharacterized membrane protein YgcG